MTFLRLPLFYFMELFSYSLVIILKTKGFQMLKTKLFLLSILSLLVLSATISQAQDKKIFKFKKGEPLKWEMKDDLKLSDDQQKKFDDLDLQHEKKMIDLRAELDKARLDKRQLIKKGNFSKNDYLSTEEKIMQAENKIHMEKEKLKMDKYSLLDEKQKKIFMDKGDGDFVFKFDMDGLMDGMKIFKDKMKRHLPCPPDVDDLEREIEIELDDNEI